ncbi:hypothetical protein C8Q80DRAFT_1145479, partial [Daedaleopsis nitida]
RTHVRPISPALFDFGTTALTACPRPFAQSKGREGGCNNEGGDEIRDSTQIPSGGILRG